MLMVELHRWQPLHTKPHCGIGFAVAACIVDMHDRLCLTPRLAECCMSALQDRLTLRMKLKSKK